MLFSILIALLNGILIGTSRAINGGLGTKVGAVRASLWNHVVGFLFLSMLIGIRYGSQLDFGSPPPFHAWLGGVLGVVFVAINSHVMPRLGASRTAALVVGAQMLVGVVIDAVAGSSSGMIIPQIVGAALIIAGVNRLRRTPPPSKGTAAD